MITTLSGANAFGLQVELRKLTADFLAEHDDFGIERLDGEEADYSRLQEALTSLPFLADRKLVILRRPSANKQFTEQLETLAGGLPETTDVIVIEPKLDKRQAYYKFLKKATDFHDFPEMDARLLAQWLVAQAKVAKGTLSQADAQYLVDRVGQNQQLVRNELDKLLLYSPTISRQTIDLLTEATPQSTIFALLESAFGGNAQRAMQLYKEQRAMKVEPPQLIAMLAWQLHILALIKAAGDRPAQAIAAEAKLSPYVVQKSQGIARKLTLGELKSLIETLLSIDVRSKRQKLDLDEALQNYLLQLAHT